MSMPFIVWVKHDWADNLGCSLTLAMCMYNFLLFCMLGIKGEIPKVMFVLDVFFGQGFILVNELCG